MGKKTGLTVSDFQNIVDEDGLSIAILTVDLSKIRDETLRSLVETARNAIEDVEIYLDNPDEDDAIDDADLDDDDWNED